MGGLIHEWEEVDSPRGRKIFLEVRLEDGFTRYRYPNKTPSDWHEGGWYPREVARLARENRRLKAALEQIRDYPRGGDYPTEVTYDEFAYKRMVDSYREAAEFALSRPGGRG